MSASMCKHFSSPFGLLSNHLCRVGALTHNLIPVNQTYCQKIFFQSSSRIQTEENEATFNNVITKDSEVDKSALEILQHKVGGSGHISYRGHPGIIRRTRSDLPARLVKAIRIVTEKYPVKTLAPKIEQLKRHLSQRQPPLSDVELAEKTKEFESKILAKDVNKLENLSDEDLDIAKEALKRKVVARLRRTVYHWKPMVYDAFTTYMYLLGRTEFDYAIYLQCFTEISKRDPDFKPTSIYNFGSRVGTGIWAADKMWKTIGEHYCVDESRNMNTVAQLLLQDGNEQETVSCIRGVHFRQFPPSPREHKFSMVVSGYMLMEQPSELERAHLVLDLWEMTTSYLVLIENGTGAGFSLINEARNIILQLSEGEESPMTGHVFAPCPHDKPCPQLRDKNQPCLTECVYKEVDFTKEQPGGMPKKNARYSYVIFKKGPRTKDHEWPRVLRHTMPSRHTHCHLCLPCGELQHVVITKGKFEKHLYSCARHLSKGDRLPVNLSSHPPTTRLDNTEIDVRDTDDSEVSNDCDDIGSQMTKE